MVCIRVVDERASYFTTLSFCLLSVLGSLLIITLFLTSRHFRSYFNKIVIYIALSDLIRSIASSLPCYRSTSRVFHIFIGVAIESTLLTSVIWSSCISITLYQVVSKNMEHYEKYHRYWFFLAFVAVPCLMCLPIITNSYDAEGTFCSLGFKKVDDIWRYSIVYFPITMFIILSILTYIKVYRDIQSLDMPESKKKLLISLGWYPIMMAIEIIPIILSRIMVYFDVDCNESVFYLITNCIFALHGFFNSCIFLSTNSLRTYIKLKREANWTIQGSVRADKSLSTESNNLLVCSDEKFHESVIG